MKIAVTGATGFLGRHLCSRLKTLGHELLEYGSKDLRLTRSLTLPKTIDVLYHLAANTKVYWAKRKPFSDFKVNALGTVNILEACRKSRIKKIIYTSTDLVYKSLGSCRETALAGENEISGPYGFSKLIGEYYLRYYSKIYGLDYVILRPSSYYGPGMKKNAVIDIINGLLCKEKIGLFHHIDSQFDFIYIEDVVEALIMSLGWKNEIINVGTGNSVTLRTLYEAVKTLIGYDVPVAYEDKLIRISVDNSKLKKLGWRQRYSLEEGLKMTVESFKDKKHNVS